MRTARRSSRSTRSRSTSRQGRPGATACNVWTTEGFPANNDGAADEGLRKVGTTLKNGTIFRVIEFAPGLAARNHRTDSIDYIVVISGEIDMELDGSVVHLKAGDVMVQRGTIHNWVNRGTAPCVLAVILIDAKSVEVGGKVPERGRVMTDTTRTPSRLWKLMTPEQRHRAASALWGEDEATNDQMQAALLIAKKMKFRPKTVMGLDDERKARYLASVPDPPEDLAARLLVVYHLAVRRAR